MDRRLLEVLGCTRCHEPLVMPSEAQLRCAACELEWPIVAGIPRFVTADDYAASFGLQWNRFRTEQIDPLAGLTQSERRWRAETGWDPGEVRGWLLDAGCGAGRFLEVASRGDAQVVGIDISSAVDAAARTLGDRTNVHLVQASLYELPFRDDAFDKAYCIGVIQHTPDPVRAAAGLPRVVKPGNALAVSMYERRRFTLLHGKYLVRPLTKRLPKQFLLGAIRCTMPLLWPLTEVLFRIPLLGGPFRFAIPVANYVDDPELTWRQRYRWAVLDTFDMLSPAYDQPLTEHELRAALEQGGARAVTRTTPDGLCVVAER